MIYFIGCPEAKVIKIGYSKDAARRLRQMQPYCPVEIFLIGELDEPASFEAQLHSFLADYISHGEWFFTEPLVVETVNGLLDGSFDRERLPKKGRRSWAWLRDLSAPSQNAA